MPSEHVEACIEELCQQGCREVRRVIALLEKHEHVTPTARLSPAERAIVLTELRAVMAVYDARPTGG
jgi:hypothetical protein